MVLSNESGAIYFREKGHAVYGKVNTPLSIVTHLNNTNDKRWVWVKPLAVGFCGSDYEGGWLKFPTGSRRFDNPDYPAVAGHENISVLLGGSEESLRHLEQRGISIGDYVVADVNIGCGYCKNDSVGKPPIQCVNGAIFAGIGTPPDSEKWLYEQTGRTHLPGAYVAEGGFMIVPGENVHKVPNEYITQDGIQLYTQADGIACGLSTLEKLALGSISPNNSLRYPSILILGAGHIGYLNGRVIKERVPEARLFYADIDEQNLQNTSKSLGISGENLYHVNPAKPNSYSRKELINGFEDLRKLNLNGRERPIDYVIDCTGGNITGKEIILREESSDEIRELLKKV